MRKYEMIVEAVCEQGSLKKINQDGILAKVGEDPGGEFGLFVVADGMGGLSSGEVASFMVIEGLHLWWLEVLPKLLPTSEINEIKKSLIQYVDEINQRIIDFGLQRGKKLGTTLSMLFIYHHQYYIYHIGDSRIYGFPRGGLKQLTKDHGWVAEALAEGLLTREEACNHPRSNALTQCMGVNHQLNPFQTTGFLKGNEGFLICSDGFYRYISEEIIEKNLNGNQHNFSSALGTLVDLIYREGARDNLSAIVIKLHSPRKKSLTIRELLKF